MPRRSKGYTKGPIPMKVRWYGRLRFNVKPPAGQQVYTRLAKNQTHARQVAAELEAKYVAGGIEVPDACG